VSIDDALIGANARAWLCWRSGSRNGAGFAHVLNAWSHQAGVLRSGRRRLGDGTEMARATRWTGRDTSGWCSQSHRLPRCVGLQALPTTHGWSLCVVPPIVVNRKPLDPTQAPGDRGELSAR